MTTDTPEVHIHEFKPVYLSGVLAYSDFGFEDLVIECRCACGMTPMEWLLDQKDGQAEIVNA